MSELRIKFERRSEVKYISHLDIMKVFERALRRADIKVTHSKGFNPHPQIIFGMPMGVGLISSCEYADVKLDDEITPEDFLTRINVALPQGFKVIEAKLKLTKGNIMSQIDVAEYEVLAYSEDCIESDTLGNKLSEFLLKDIIMLEKTSKSSKKQIDIKPLILNLKVARNDVTNGLDPSRDYYMFKMLLRAGQKANLKPDEVICAFNEFSGHKIRSAQIDRKAIYMFASGDLTSPMDDMILLQQG